MVIEMLMNLIKLGLLGLINTAPDVQVSAELTGFIEWFSNILNAVSYFLPVSDLFMLFSIYIVVINFDIIWKLIQRLWDALPLT